MKDNIIEKVKKGKWFIRCNNKKEYFQIMKICDKAGLIWFSGRSCLDDWFLNEYEDKLPVYICNYNKNFITFARNQSVLDEKEPLEDITNIIFDNESIGKLLQKGNWVVTCSNENDYNYLMQLCIEQNISWLSGKPCLHNDKKFEQFPVYIAMDNRYNLIFKAEQKIIFDEESKNYFLENNLIDITDLVFKDVFNTIQKLEQVLKQSNLIEHKFSEQNLYIKSNNDWLKVILIKE